LVKDAPGSSLASCGSVTGTAAEIQARGFTVNVLGAVAIAAYDAVGNVGKLSAVACGKTEPVIDFFQNYRAAGGEGGGGCSCRVGSGDEPLLAWVAFALCAASLMRRRACKR
jgi:MYXO-CTERM domain-containing protein